MSLGLTPTAMDLALWHLKGIQTFSEAGGDFNTYGAAWWITSQIPTALNVLEINSTWSWEEDYAAWLSR